MKHNNVKKPVKEKPKYNMWQNTGYMIRQSWKWKEKKVLILCLLSAFLAVGMNLANLLIAPGILSAVERKVSFTELLLTILCFTAAILVFSFASSYVSNNTMYGRLSVRTALMDAIYRKDATTSYPNKEDKKFAKLFSLSMEATGGPGSATEAVWETLTKLIKDIAGFIIYTLMLTHVQPLLIAVILLTTTVGYFIRKKVDTYDYKHRDEESKAWRRAEYVSGIAENRAAAKDIRIFGLRPWILELQGKAMRMFEDFRRKANKVHLIADIADLIFAFLRNGIAYYYLIHLILQGGCSISEFLLYFSTVGGFSAWITGILSDLHSLHRQSLHISNVREYLEYPEPFLFEKGKPIENIHSLGEIRLENVSFRYPDTDKDVLHRISLTIHPGEKIAVVGLNGAGKTTLVKLICGFLDPTEGRVLLDGQDIRQLNRAMYYKMFSAVFQTFSLLGETIAVNVAGTRDHIHMEKVRDCIEKAGLTSKIQSLPDGLETKLCRDVYEDAAELSGGETQRLMLARALYKDAPFILLDEPTAALDPLAEADMYQKYNSMTKGKTSVYISHRLASTRFCDRILMLQDGVIAEEGTHETLLKRKGPYADLFAVQSKYYREGEVKNEK